MVVIVSMLIACKLNILIKMYFLSVVVFVVFGAMQKFDPYGLR